MNKLAMTAIAGALAFSVAVFAEEAEHSDKVTNANSAPARLTPLLQWLLIPPVVACLVRRQIR